MRTLLLATALTLAAAPVWAKVVMNSFDENGSANARAEMRAKAEAAGEPIPVEAQEYRAPDNAFTSTWAAAQAKLNQVVAGTEQEIQQNKVNNAKKALAKAERKKANAETIAAAKAKVAEEEAKLVKITAVTTNYSVSASEHWNKSKEYTKSAMKPTGDEPIAGFAETEYKDE